MQEGTYDKEKFVATLKGKGIDTVLRYTEEGRIYGTTFIDHRTGCVLNGSRMGKELSANALQEHFTLPYAGQPPISLSVPVEEPENRQGYSFAKNVMLWYIIDVYFITTLKNILGDELGKEFCCPKEKKSKYRIAFYSISEVPFPKDMKNLCNPRKRSIIGV